MKMVLRLGTFLQESPAMAKWLAQTTQPRTLRHARASASAADNSLIVEVESESRWRERRLRGFACSASSLGALITHARKKNDVRACVARAGSGHTLLQRSPGTKFDNGSHNGSPRMDCISALAPARAT